LTNVFEDLPLRLVPEPTERRDLIGLGGLFQFVERRHVKLGPQPTGALRAQPLYLHHVQQAGRDRIEQLVPELKGAAVENVGHVVGHRVADALDVHEGAFAKPIRHSVIEPAKGAGGPGEGPRAVRIAPCKLQQVGSFLENLSDLVIAHLRGDASERRRTTERR